jgi:hypothetical protein
VSALGGRLLRPCLFILGIVLLPIHNALSYNWDLQNLDNFGTLTNRGGVRVLSTSNQSGMTLQLQLVCNRNTLDGAAMLSNFPINPSIGMNGFRRFNYTVTDGSNYSVKIFSEVDPRQSELNQRDLIISLYKRKDYSAQEIWSPLFILEQLGNKQLFPNILKEIFLQQRWPLSIRLEGVEAKFVEFKFQAPQASVHEAILRECFGIEQQQIAEENALADDSKQASDQSEQPIPLPKVLKDPIASSSVPTKTKAQGESRSKPKTPAAKKVKAVDAHSDWKKLIDPLVRRWITSFPNESGQKRKVTFLVTLNQSGFIIDVKKEKSSNDETWDQTVERAIWASSSWPLTKTHKSQSPLRISFETPD